MHQVSSRASGRHIPGLHQAATTQEQEIPDGFFLVRVEKATYRAYKDKPFLTLILTVEEPRQFSACRFSARIYCTPKALWKLSWFLRDFGYDKSLPFDPFKQEIERALNGPDSEPWDMMYFKLYKSQIPVVEQAGEIASRMLGSDKSRGYCLEMICADFLAGANLGKDEPEMLLNALHRCFCLLLNAQQTAFLQRLTAA